MLTHLKRADAHETRLPPHPSGCRGSLITAADFHRKGALAAQPHCPAFPRASAAALSSRSARVYAAYALLLMKKPTGFFTVLKQLSPASPPLPAVNPAVSRIRHRRSFDSLPLDFMRFAPFFSRAAQLQVRLAAPSPPLDYICPLSIILGVRLLYRGEKKGLKKPFSPSCTRKADSGILADHEEITPPFPVGPPPARCKRSGLGL